MSLEKLQYVRNTSNTTALLTAVSKKGHRADKRIMFQTEPNVCQSSSLSYSTQRCMLTPCKHVHWCGLKCSIPASALMRERSKRRAELFSLSQSVSAARSQRLLMSLYCCWISKLSKSVGEMVLMVSRLEENTFNLQFRHRDTEASEVNACREGRGRYVILED